jgi:peptidoglycan/LPS O-acetylase OafA/YrhL
MAITTSAKREAILDGWRGLAIAGVLIDHFITDRGLNFGRFGVELFFVLSGRLMAEILFVRTLPLPTFFFRRFSRIYPALFVFASTTFFVCSTTRHHKISLGSYVSSISMTANYASIYYMHTIVLDHIWSLCIEEHIYILLGLIAFVARRRRRFNPLFVMGSISLIFMVNGIVQTWAGSLDYYQVYWRTDVRGASILVGAMCYLMLYDRQTLPGMLTSRVAPIAIGVCALALNINVVPDPIKYTIGTLLLAVSVTILPRAPEWCLNVLRHPILTHVGILSYSLYLWQQPFIIAQYYLVRWAEVVIIPIFTGVALLSYYFVERPARLALNSLWASRGNKLALGARLLSTDNQSQS